MLSNYFGSVTNVIIDNNRLVEEVAMPDNRHKPEEIVAKLGQVDQVLANSYPDGRAPAQRAASCCLVGPNAKFRFDENGGTRTTTECA
jgi:hypothetical protein